MHREEPWWKTGVLYQIYPLSFADSNGDGFGDLRGVVDHLDHLEWLGVDGLWLSPITVSPNADWGYDVADYCAVQPALGTLADIDLVIAAAGRRGIRVLLDLVPNHTSEQHPWFVESRSSRDSGRRDWYVWADPEPDGSPPNNWLSSFGGSAWTLDPTTAQFYLHNHLPQQPDLNWWNEDVRSAFDDIARFWFDRGVAGFRIDVCNMIVKDAELRDNPPATEADDFGARALGQRTVYNGNRPEVHDVIRRWRAIAESYDPPRVLIGETPVEAREALARFYGRDGDGLNLAFNFPFITADFAAEPLRRIVEETEALLPPDAWPVWTGSNHDMSRLATRWAGDDTKKIGAALVMLLTLRGTPVLYQGDEIGLGDVPVARDRLRDPLGVRYFPAYAGRDAMRTPMPWRPGPGAGFTQPGVTPWLPLGDPAACNVEDQRRDPASLLTLTRDLIELRRGTPDLRSGSYATRPAPSSSPGVWVWRRGSSFDVVVNLAESEASLSNVEGRVRIGTDRGRDGEPISGALHVRGWEALVIER
ncbi:MAG: alpha-glucosidase [Actinomycetota bacterium]|nr:alpha-glucosidase [Actinomycetota bacterium]